MGEEGFDPNAVVRTSIDALLSREPEHLAALFSTPELGALDSATAHRIREHVVEPLRAIADRGGKGWRAAIMLAACEAVGGDAEQLASWAGVFELLHVGSLIVDDVQDDSLIRRGGPCCHRLYDRAIAINAGNAAYFLLDCMVDDLALPPEAKLRVYRLFFRCVRAAHAGQGIDLAGLRQHAERDVAAGRAERILHAVRTVHELKTGYPVVLCMLVGAIAGGADDALCRQLAGYGRAVGLAFQIGDDILNLVGFERGLKTRGEDILHGKITYPIAVALSRMERKDAEQLLAHLERAAAQPELVDEVLGIITATEATERARDLAVAGLQESWAPLEACLRPGQARDILRDYGPRFLDRHY